MPRITYNPKKKIEKVEIGDVLVFGGAYARMVIREENGRTYASLNMEEGRVAFGGFDSIDDLLKFYEDEVGETDIVVVKSENVEVIV